MDTFMDIFTHKRNAQEMIQANTSAEAAELEQMKQQMAEYDRLLQDMRKVNLKTVENMEQIQTMLQESLKKIESIQESSDVHKDMEELTLQIKEQTEGLISEMKKQMEDVLPEMKKQAENILPEMKKQTDELLPEIKKQMDEAFSRSDSYMHTESVKVYRNVQAAITEELDKQTDILGKTQKECEKRQKVILPVSIITMLLVIADIAIKLMSMLIK